MKYLSLIIPGYEQVDSNLPGGAPAGGLFNYDSAGNIIGAGSGSGVLQTILNFSLVVIILIALYFIVQGGIDIIQSEGKKEKLNRGREKVIYAIFGLIMVFLSFLFISAGSAFFGFDLLCILFNPTACK